MSSSVAPGRVDEFDHFYRAHFGNTVAMTYGLTADLPEAHDIAQEAFCRAWARWRELSGFDNPAAWVRKVAVNLARSRWRRLRVAAEYLIRERPEDVGPLDPGHVAVVAALRRLPPAQREALVLHYIVDLPLTEVAAQMRVPVGTVKSWLHRGRSALADHLRIDIDAAVVPPGAEQVVKTMKNRRRVRTAAALVLVMALVSGVIALSRTVGPSPDPGPIDSPTPVPSSTKDDAIRAVDWVNATVDFGTAATGCPTGAITFGPLDTGAAGRLTSYPGLTFHPNRIAVGDLDGDGRAEALLPAYCHFSPEGDDAAERLFVVRRSADGRLTATAGADGRRNFTLHSWITGGVVYLDAMPRDSVGGGRRLGEVEAWRWEGGTLQPVETSGRYPLIDVLNLSPISGQLACRPATAELRPRFGSNLRARAGDRELDLTSSRSKQVYAHFGREGDPYLVLGVGCGGDSPNETFSVVIFDRVNGEWRALDQLAVPRNAWALAGDRIMILNEGHTWDGRAFKRVTSG